MADLLKRPAAALATRDDDLALPDQAGMTVGMLEQELLNRMPAQDAEDWDRTGLMVGDPSTPVTKVAVALDPTVAAIREAASQGANVLVTHHPPYLGAPDAFRPADSVAQVNGAGVFEAIRSDVALMCFHTALDVNPLAYEMIPAYLRLDLRGVADPTSPDGCKGYGAVCVPRDEEPLTLEQLAARCVASFGRMPRVWGDPFRRINTVVAGTGSGSNLTDYAVEHQIDCLVVGELKYHAALDCTQAGVCVIELGHDVSELPLTVCLRAAIRGSGVPDSAIITLDQNNNWWTPESTRL